ncbi:MAG: adenylate/guanylate cyclase domain-containing protein [Chloroflexota bacterium]
MEPGGVENTPTIAGPRDLNDLLRQIERLQAAVTEQQRSLMSAREPQVKRVALHGSGELIELLQELREASEQLDRQLKQQVKEQRQLHALQAVSAVINSSLDIDVLLEQLMDAIIQLTNAERAMLLLADEQGELSVKTARHFDHMTLDQAASAEISRTIVRQVATSGEPVVALDAQEDERFASQDSIVSYKLRSILCVPLRTRGEIIGVLYADNRVSSGIFGDMERDALAAFADQAAVALDNARLFQEVAGMRDLMDNVFVSIDSGVITVDAADRISFVNRAAEQLLDMPVASVLDQPYEVVLNSIGLPVQPLVEQVRVDGLTHSEELDTEDESGVTRALSITLSPLQNTREEELGGVAIVIEDVSEKKRVESLRRYLPSAFVDRVRDLDAAQRPQRRDVTVLFADIRRFSTLGEHLEPEELIHLANGFFAEAVTAIADYQGLIDKFVGDAVMALFNTPLNPQEDHVSQAVRAALLIRENVIRFRSSLPVETQLHFGIGIHTGEVVVGNVGSQQRKDYSAIGDVVNLTKRLQEMAGYDEILLSRTVFDAVKSWVTAEPLDPVQVKGRQTWEEVFRLTGRKP